MGASARTLFFFFFFNLRFLGISLKLPQGHKLVVSKKSSDKNRLTWLMCSHDGFKCLRFWTMPWGQAILGNKCTEIHKSICIMKNTHSHCLQSVHTKTPTLYSYSYSMFKAQRTMAFHCCLQVNCTGHRVDWRRKSELEQYLSVWRGPSLICSIY